MMTDTIGLLAEFESILIVLLAAGVALAVADFFLDSIRKVGPNDKDGW